MLNTQKLLYIFPDVAYIAEVLPDKKPHSFSIQSFTQINGTFLTEEALIAPHINKLFTKLETGEEYHVIFPDYLFTNTIVSVPEKTDEKIAEELKKTILPKLTITDETHSIESAVLNQIRGTARVQLSAIEHELLAPLRVAAQQAEVTIVGISPLSWTVKAIVSLEPSISVLQLGANVYLCEHYIGIDQAATATLEDLDVVAEAIKSLKGAEPNIQTVYLLSNQLIEDRLAAALTKIVPIQQMTKSSSDQERMPAHVKDIIEAAAKTLSIQEYPVPIFKLGKPTADELSLYGKSEPETKGDDESVEAVAALPKPTTPEVSSENNASEPEEVTTQPEPTAEPSIQEEMKQEEAPEEAPETPQESTPETAAEEVVEADEPDDEVEEPETPTLPIPPVTPAVIAAVPPTTPEVSSENKATEPEEVTTQPEPTPATDADIDLRQFVQAQSTTELPKTEKPIVEQSPVVRTTIKNKSGVQPMLKVIFITLGVFCVTVAIGIGVGLAIIKFSGAENAPANPEVEVEATPTPTPTPTATPTPSPTATASAKPAAAATQKILIVNATTKAGYAGTFKTKIENAKLGTVTAANASGTYTDGFLISLKSENPDTVAALAEAMGVELTVDSKAAAEDPQKRYDIVIVLAE